MKPPAAVKAAIKSFCAPATFTLKPPTEAETSVIFNWGVRVEYEDEGQLVLAWVCLADQACRSIGSVFCLSNGKTSRATKHLREAHGIVSEKTSAEQNQKRKRDDEVEYLKQSAVYRAKKTRLALLLETQRIVNQNLPFQFCESRESRLIESLLKSEDAVTTLNSTAVTHAMVELYASTRQSVTEFLASAKLKNTGSFSLMADFWTCQVTHRKYLGVRVYLVDSQFNFRSVLLGIRAFDPMFGVRDKGIQDPFRAFLDQLLGDFGLNIHDFFGATTDAGPDVKKMMETNLKLQWEWCLAHMAHAAARAAYGGEDGESLNPQLRALRKRMKDTIRQVKTVEKTGDLFAALCGTMTDDKATQLIDYSAHRFLSLGKSIRRILDKWEVLKSWYRARADQAVRAKKPPVTFPLSNDYDMLVQLLSLILPIQKVNAMSQAESECQVEVLLALYQARLTVLKAGSPLKDYRSTKDQPIWITEDQFTPLFIKTRDLLRKALDDRFFARYTNPDKRLKCPFVFEMQQRLHPVYKAPEKSLNRIVRTCIRDNDKDAGIAAALKTASEVNSLIHSKLRDLMIKVADPFELHGDEEKEESQSTNDEFAEEFGVQHRHRSSTDRLASIVDEELHRWHEGTQRLRKHGDKPETVLEFWKRMMESGEFTILPRVAKVLFAVPSSSAQIERDFGACGQIIRNQRASLSGSSVDMATFLQRNSRHVDISQCEELKTEELSDHIPVPVTVSVQRDRDLTSPLNDSDDEELIEMFSQSSIDYIL